MRQRRNERFWNRSMRNCKYEDLRNAKLLQDWMNKFNDINPYENLYN